jgi:dTDP-4-amino-4,6-dideoxygalactose transaminase
MANGIYKITEDFEKALSDYTGAPYAVTVDNQSNALFLSLMYEKVSGKEITIPARTYPSVPRKTKHSGAEVKFSPVE